MCHLMNIASVILFYIEKILILKDMGYVRIRVLQTQQSQNNKLKTTTANMIY